MHRIFLAFCGVCVLETYSLATDLHCNLLRLQNFREIVEFRVYHHHQQHQKSACENCLLHGKSKINALFRTALHRQCIPKITKQKNCTTAFVAGD